MPSIANTPEPPYWAVIFTSKRRDTDPEEYAEVSERMDHLAAQQDGFLGVETFRDADGVGVNISYWRDEEAIRAWKRQQEHAEAQRRGRERWYDRYVVRVARVEREYEFGG